MKMVRLGDLEPGDIFAMGAGVTAEIGKVLAHHVLYTKYEDQNGHLQSMRYSFFVWVDE